jgi:transcription termination factor NusB
MLEQHILVLLFWFLETKNESELDITDAMDALWRLRLLDIVRKRVLKSKVSELVYRATSSMCLPGKIKIKERVKKDKSKTLIINVNRYSSYFNNIDKLYSGSRGLLKRLCT